MASLALLCVACDSGEPVLPPGRISSLVITGAVMTPATSPVRQARVEVSITQMLNSTCAPFARAPLAAETNSAGRFRFEIPGGLVAQTMCATIVVRPPAPWLARDTTIHNLTLRPPPESSDSVNVLLVVMLGGGQDALLNKRQHVRSAEIVRVHAKLAGIM